MWTPKGVYRWRRENHRVLIVRDLASSLAYCLEIASGDTSAGVIKPLHAALTQLGQSLLEVYAPGVALDQVVPRPMSGGFGDPSQGYRPLRAEELGRLEDFPPLEVYLRVVETHGILHLPQHQDRVLSPEGLLTPSRRLSTRGLLAGSLRRLTQAFRRAFPEAEVPCDFQSEPAAFELLPAWAARFTPPACQIIPQLQEEATEAGFCQWWLAEAKSAVSFKSRLAFWKGTPAKEREAQLKERLNASTRRLHKLWQQLLAEAARAAAELPPLQLRDAIIQVQELIPLIRTDRGTRSTRHRCPVQGREVVEDQLARVRLIFRDSYGLTASMADFMTELSRPGPAIPVTSLGLGPVAQPLLLGALRARFRSLADLPRLETLRQRHGELDYERQVVDARIGFWDRVNVFRQTPEKERRGQLTRDQQNVLGELEQLREQVAMDFFRAAEVYPPLVIHLLTGPVESAVANVRAVCRCTRRTEERNGRREEVETWECELEGLKEATQAAREWAGEFARLFGALPGPARLLELWAG